MQTTYEPENWNCYDNFATSINQFTNKNIAIYKQRRRTAPSWFIK